MDSAGNRSSCYRRSLGSIEMSAIKGCSRYRARDCIVNILETKRTVRNREVSVL